MGPKQLAVKNCDRCIRKAVCIIYYGYTEMELQHGNPSLVDPQEFVSKLAEALAAKCTHYMELKGKTEQ
jgi:hypothetical protein